MVTQYVLCISGERADVRIWVEGDEWAGESSRKLGSEGVVQRGKVVPSSRPVVTRKIVNVSGRRLLSFCGVMAAAVKTVTTVTTVTTMMTVTTVMTVMTVTTATTATTALAVMFALVVKFAVFALFVIILSIPPSIPLSKR
jgi:hypothetical protein